MTSQDKEEPIVTLEHYLLTTEKMMAEENHEKQLKGALNTIYAIDKFLRLEHPHLSRKSLKAIIEEISDLYSGFKPKLFAQLKSKQGGRPKSIPTSSNNAAIIAAIEILIEVGYKPGEAIEEAVKLLKRKRTSAQLERLRKKYKSASQKKEIINLIFRLKKEGLARSDPYKAASIFLKTASQTLK